MSDPQTPPPIPQAPFTPPVPPAGAPAQPAAPPVGAPSAPPAGAPPVPPTGAPTAPGQYTAPPGHYAPPAGAYTAGPAGYQQYAGSYQPQAPAAPGRKGLGVVALILALLAFIVPAIIAGGAGFGIGVGLGEAGIDELSRTSDLAVLAPVRTQVLWAEIAFWIGTVLGIWALVQGFIAIAKRRGRGAGIAAVVIAFLAPGLYFTVLFFALVAGGVAEAIPSF